ncbi:MAG: Crp/Fnr family transcriptional regulator [Planctomycetota bacterium]|nr:Crp/Fnr family transcriptional regulator [Planctomycetota bacterium]
MVTRSRSLGETIYQLIKDSDAVQRTEFASGQVIHEPSDPANTFCVIESGEIRVFDVLSDGTSRLLEILGPGDWLGAAALGHLPVCTKRAVAATPTVALSMPIEELRSHLLQHGDMAVEVLEEMTRRLFQAWAEGSQLVSEDCRLRLIKTLLRFSTSAAAVRGAEGVVLHITHAQLAQAVGAARETVSICLTELREKQMIQTGRNRLSFDPEKLRLLETA